MLTITELIDNLVDTELANLSIKDKDGDIKPNRLKQIIANVNLGLIDLYTRYRLKVIETTHKTKSDKTNYSPMDTVNNDSWQILEVLAVFDNGCQVLQEGCMTYSRKDAKNGSDIILNYTPHNEHTLTILSQAAHPKVTVQSYCDGQECHLPTPYISALYYFVASRMYKSINNQLDGDISESTRYLQRYYDELTHLTNAGVDVSEFTQTHWFKQRGFV